MNSNYIIDTNILILSFSGRLKEKLPLAPLGISIISEIEILAYPHLTTKDEEKLRTILSKLTCYSLSNEVKEQTILLRRQYKIKLPDAIICATAIINQAILLTNDKQLIQINELQTQSLATKNK